MTSRIVVSLACALACASVSSARAGQWSPWSCGLPGPPLVVEYSEISVSPEIRDVFAKAHPPLVLATSGAPLGQELRAGGARTMFWQMNIQRLLGNTQVPADPTTIPAAADKLYERAVATTGCSTPGIALNELQGPWVRSPWSPNNALYREDALAFLRRLHERGANPYLMVTTTPRPFTASQQAADWWRQAAQVADLVLQVHFDGRHLYGKGPLDAGRLRRAKMRSVIRQFEALGIPPARLGLLHGFQSGLGYGGREGLPLSQWLRVVKWEVLAAKQVVGETIAAGAPLGSDWSWGWGDYPALSKVDVQKPITACVYLWVRNPALCDGPARAAAAGVSFNTSLSEGAIALAPDVECQFGADAVPSDAVARFATLRGESGPLGRDVALAALFQRVLEMRRAVVDPEEVAHAEQSIVAERFGGNQAAYAQALAAANADPSIALHIIGDQLRRRAILRTLPRRMSFREWSLAGQQRALAHSVCVRDDPPPIGIVDLTRWLPFLRVS